MSPLDEHQWAVTQVVRDWKERKTEKPRNVLPTKTTSSTLRYVRQMACHKAGASNCPCWAGNQRVTPLGEFPCTGCNTPAVTMREFSIALFGKDEGGKDAELGKPSKEERLIRRWMNSEAPMQPDDYRRVLANAWANGWIGTMQLQSLALNAIELEGTSSVLRRFIKRLRDRVSFRKNRAVTKDDAAVIAQELESERIKVADELAERGRGRIERSPFIDDDDKKWLLATNSPQQDG